MYTHAPRRRKLGRVLPSAVFTRGWHAHFGAALATWFLVACSPPIEPVTTPEPPPKAAPAKRAQPAVANPDIRGVSDQPDYDRQALAIRTSVGPQLPDTLPTSLAACNAMLDAAVRFYKAVEKEAEIREQLVAHLQHERGDEIRRCQADLSIEAALCVTLQLDELTSEYPWIIDQCARAFPRFEPSSEPKDISIE